MPALVSIEGIGEQYAQKLALAQIGSTQALLERGKTRQGRKEIAKIAGVTVHQILDWVNRADLFRVDGIGEEYSDLLEASGVDTVVELSKRDPEHLHSKLLDVNGRRRLVRRPPALKMVEDWIAQAKKLPRAVEY